MTVWYRSRRFWLIALGIVLLSTLFLAGGNIVQSIRLQRQIAAFERERDALRETIRRDSLLLEALRYDENLEAYAREHFGLQRPDEVVYLFKK